MMSEVLKRPFLMKTTRRRFMAGSLLGMVAAATAKLPGLLHSAKAAATKSSGATQRNTTTLIVNGEAKQVSLDSRTTLLDALREHLHLTGTKKGCDHGQCGACTVLVNDRRINACLTLAAMHDGDRITTIEGLGTPETLHPLQKAFITHDGFQCGYCTPGQICSAKGMLAEAKAGMPSHVSPHLTGEIELTDEEIRERMSGNLCRCAAYPNILAAIRDVEQAA